MEYKQYQEGPTSYIWRQYKKSQSGPKSGMKDKNYAKQLLSYWSIMVTNGTTQSHVSNQCKKWFKVVQSGSKWFKVVQSGPNIY